MIKCHTIYAYMIEKFVICIFSITKCLDLITET